MTTQRYSFIAHIDAPDAVSALEARDRLDEGEHPEGVRVFFGEIDRNIERVEKIREMAVDQYHREGELEFDDGAIVSEGDDNGAYVQCWRWVDFTDTELDKDAEEEDPDEIIEEA